MHRIILAAVLVAALIGGATAPVAASHCNQTSGETDVVGSATPDFLGSMMADLPVPDFVAHMFKDESKC